MTDTVAITSYDLATLLMAARRYLDAFTDEDQCTLPEKLAYQDVYQDVEAVVAKYTATTPGGRQS